MKSATIFISILLVNLISSKAQTDWQVLNQTTTMSTFVASSFINDNEGWLADDKAILCHTKDGGQTWDTTSTNNYFLKLDFINAFNGFAIAGDAFQKTTDGGHTWQSLNMPGSIGDAIYFWDSNTGFVNGSQVIYKTTDGGTTWQTVSTDKVSFVDFDFINESVGIAAAYDDDSSKCIWRTTDGGITWNNVFRGENYLINSVSFKNDNNGWAVGYYEQTGLWNEPVILHSADGGITWQVSYLNIHPGGKGDLLLDIRFMDELNGIAIANFSESVITSDGGLNWNLTENNKTIGLPDLAGVYKTLAGFNVIYIAGKFGYVVKWK